MFLLVMTFLTIVNSYSAILLPRLENGFSELEKQRADSLSNNFLLKNNVTSPSTPRFSAVSNITSTDERQPKKWQVGRVTRKQYEIINMLWRKTKVFVNVEVVTPKLTQSTATKKYDNLTKKVYNIVPEENPFIFTTRPPILQSLTPSYIEFYYSDEFGEQAVKNDCFNSKCHLKSNEKVEANIMNTTNSSFLLFHVKGPLLTGTTIDDHPTAPFNHKYKTISKTNTLYVSPTPTTTENQLNEEAERISSMKSTRIPRFTTESTTIYDKIKFFEMYDKLTQVPFVKQAMFEFDYEKYGKEMEINKVEKILLKHVDQSSHEHKKAKHSKKHIIENDKNLSQSCVNSTKENSKPKPYLNVTTERQNNVSSFATSTYGSIVRSDTKTSKNVFSYINKSVSWSKYPFTAVYVYEPSQVHCDAASISAHWLVASGSCLSRLNQSPVLGDGRSAFVAYCGDRWWQPERVSYVKYSLVHPWYHPRDRTRRNLYNIGVIQVVTSMMSACSEWAPVSLMSHQFATSQGGSEASALGWGLDRYDTRYGAADLPRGTLKIYKGLVFSNSCPGNIGYNKVKRLDEGGGLKNVYCLSLPPYSGEERDPVHGSLLLVGGKLMALYLQEERRPWGEQSAQYTGVWNLIPWVTKVAKEPEEMESFTVEI